MHHRESLAGGKSHASFDNILCEQYAESHEVSKRHRNSPVTERPVRDICTKTSGQIYDGAERSWKHGKKSGIAEVQAFVFWMCEHQKDESFF